VDDPLYSRAHRCRSLPRYPRAQIEREVRELIGRCRREIASWQSDDWEVMGGDPAPRYLKLGYTIAMHKGRDLYRDGDTIAGLPVVIDRYASRSITVFGDYVWVESHQWDDLMDDTRSVEEERRVEQTLTW
jgi:hypothetical protein